MSVKGSHTGSEKPLQPGEGDLRGQKTGLNRAVKRSCERHGADARCVRSQSNLASRCGPFNVGFVALETSVCLALIGRTSNGEEGARKLATSARMENLILKTRKQLRDESDLGEYGAAAIHRALVEHGSKKIPSLRTIGRILLRRGALDGRRRVRRPPPPKGWYLPPVAARQAELDCFDFIEDLHLRGGAPVNILTGISLHGGLCGAWVQPGWTAKITAETLIGYWREHGLPDYAQFDNDTIFCGARQFRDSFGRVIRLCLQLGVTPVFTPPHETGFQALIENFNGRWQVRVWFRFHHENYAAIQARSDRFTCALRHRAAPRIEAAPPRRPFPVNWKPDYQRPLEGTVIYLRRTNERGHVEVQRRNYLIDPLWTNRLVRAEVDLSNHEIRFYRLRRRQPDDQPLCQTVAYTPPKKRFRADDSH